MWTMRFGLGLLLMAALIVPQIGCSKKKKGSDPVVKNEKKKKKGGGGGKKKTDEEKINELFAELMKHAEADDITAFSAHMTEDSQKALAGTFYVAGAMSVMIPAKDKEAKDKAKKVEAVFKKQDVDKAALDKFFKDMQGSSKKDPPKPEELRKMFVKLGGSVKNSVEFMAEMLKATPDKGESNPFKEGKLEELKVDGDSATAKLKTPKHEMPLEFKKADGEWKLELGVSFFAAMKPKGKGKGPAK